jgi:hypothetical protein
MQNAARETKERKKGKESTQDTRQWGQTDMSIDRMRRNTNTKQEKMFKNHFRRLFFYLAAAQGLLELILWFSPDETSKSMVGWVKMEKYFFVGVNFFI